MGKAQSKRSVDITTEANKEGNASNETAGKVEKIEDADQLKANQVNGDASQPATEEKPDNPSGEKETEKDKETEKSSEKPATDESAAVAAVVPSVDETVTPAAEAKPDEAAKESTETVENGGDTTVTSLDDSKVTTENGETEGSTKKKKEKSKKRFLSFRSFSFSKKDKQKPAKKSAEEQVASPNGELTEETPETENATTEQNGENEKTETAPKDEVKPVDAPTENSTEAQEQQPQQNGSTETSTEQAKPEKKQLDEIKNVAKETVEEAIDSAAKSVDQKINESSIKPEVNETLSQQDQESNEQHEQQKTDQAEKIEIDVESSIQSNDDIQTNLTENQSIGDCANQDQQQHQQTPPPPLPHSPPPSQVSLFAKSVASDDETTADASHSNEVQEDNVVESEAKPTEIENQCNVEIKLENPIENLNDIQIASIESSNPTNASNESNELENVSSVNDICNETPLNPDEIAQTIAMLDNATNNDNKQLIDDDLPPPPPQSETSQVLSQTADEPIESNEPIVIDVRKDEISADISSPLQQNSLESLSPSDADENQSTENVDETNHHGNNGMDKECVIITDLLANKIIDDTNDLKTITEEKKSNGECVDANENPENGAHSDKENGFEHSVAKEVNGNAGHDDDEIIDASNKLEKLNLANSSTSQEVVAAE